MTAQVHETYSKTLTDWLAQGNGFLTKEIQELGIQNFKNSGIPNTKWEDWKYTNIGKFLAPQLNRVQDKTFDKSSLMKHVFSKDYRIVFINGLMDEESSLLPKGLIVETLKENNISERDLETIKLSLNQPKETFTSLNLACALEFTKITLSKNTKIDGPVTILHLATESSKESMISPRVIIEAETSSEATIVEHFTSQVEEELMYMTNHHTTCLVSKNAKLSHIKIQDENHFATHIGKVHAEVERDAEFSTFSFSVGAKTSRNNLEVNLNDEGASAHVDGLYTLREDQHNDNFSLINHRKSHTNSTQLFKGILDQKSRGVFTGKIVVHRDAQLVESAQLNKNLLLSKRAHVDTRPQLEVYADDVKCAHGATVGQISEDEVFYLESRGIPKERAQKILCHAFAGECLEKIKDQSTKLKLGQLLFDKFEKFALDELGKEE